MSAEITKYISIVAIIVSIVVCIYVYREFSFTRAKIGEIKYLKNQFINIETRINDVETRQDKIDPVKKILISDNSSSSSSDYEVYESSDDDDEDEETHVIEQIIEDAKKDL
jgi:hypothetical protein